jgi:predicted ATPase
MQEDRPAVNGLRMYEAELYRLKGDLLARRSATRPEAEACLRHAIEVARRHGARSFELRAAVSLGSLWQARGRSRTAGPLIAEIYQSFTEGFETQDLREAAARLGVPTKRRP